MGHALNKILKYIINRYKVGLLWPSNRVKSSEVNGQGSIECSDTYKIKAKAAKFAKATVTTQMKYFKLQVFGQMVMKGYIYRGRKPVHWSPSSRTALVEAELEYSENHVSKSIYAAFKITNPSKPGLLLARGVPPYFMPCHMNHYSMDDPY
ncbi:hypothetical protein ABZP36_035096 [Zizania latifolia]